MRRVVKLQSVVMAASLLAGCVASPMPPYQADRELADLLAAYRKQTELSTEREVQRQAQGVRAFRVERRADTGEWLVSADLERASLASVVRRLLDETRTAYLFRTPSLSGQLTARFERLPLRVALSILLEAQGLSVWEQQGMLIIGDQPPPGAPEGSSGAIETPHPSPAPPPLAPSATTEAAATVPPAAGAATPTANAAAVSRAVQLRYLDVDTVGKMFDGLYPIDQQTGARAVQMAPQPFTSTVLLSGTAPAVARASRLLGELDRDPAHVLLEVLIVEFDTNELERLGTSLQDTQRGRITGLTTSVGSAAQNAFSFTYASAGGAPSMFKAIIDVLSSQDKARVIARPYTAAMSGKKALVQITRSRDIQQPASVSGTSGTVNQTPPIARETGVKLDVTPWVLADGRIRLELNVEESVFIDDLATNVISETDKNTAATTMMVESGQSIIIGGLTVRRKSSSNAGLPWLRHVPLLNLVSAQQSSAEQKQDVIIYITPYIIGPGVNLPFPQPDAFKFRDGQDDLTEMEGASEPRPAPK